MPLARGSEKREGDTNHQYYPLLQHKWEVCIAIQIGGTFGPHLRPVIARPANSIFRIFAVPYLGPATTQNLAVKFDGETCGGVLVENASDDFPQQKKLENLLPNFAPEVRHQFREDFANFTLEIAGAYVGPFGGEFAVRFAPPWGIRNAFCTPLWRSLA